MFTALINLFTACIRIVQNVGSRCCDVALKLTCVQNCKAWFQFLRRAMKFDTILYPNLANQLMLTKERLKCILQKFPGS